MKADRGTVGLVVALLAMFGIELVTNSVGNNASLLKLGALPDKGELNEQYWRFATYSFLHFNWLHLLVNAALLLWIGRIVERRVGIAQTGMIYFFSVLSSAAIILLVHSLHPKVGATVGASGGVFGLLGAALIISYRQNRTRFGRERRLRASLWVAILAGLGISFLPNISMAGHISGLIGGPLLVSIVRIREDEG
jgi:membrane associated rhomboid family serine protease